MTTPPPVVVAQQAVKQLDLPSNGIEMAPPTTSPQLVNVSTWLWLDPATWKPYTATASIAGVSATATATPQKVVWNIGDGNTVTCDNQHPLRPVATECHDNLLLHLVGTVQHADRRRLPSDGDDRVASHVDCRRRRWWRQPRPRPWSG